MATKKSEIMKWDDYESDQTGFEHVEASDLGIPFLTICQSGSPEYKKGDPNYETKKIPGIEEGDVFHSTERRIVYKHGEDPIILVPYSYRRAYVEWKPRNEGGGYVQTHLDPRILSETVRGGVNGKQDILPNGNIIVTTAYFFCYLIEEEKDPAQIVVSLTSTQLKKSRAWLNLAKANVRKDGNVLPLYSSRYCLRTVGESNADGSWFGWSVERGDLVQDPILVDRAVSDGQNINSLIAALPAPKEADVPI